MESLKGKTTVVATLAEWYADNSCRADLLDMDPDNKAEGSFKALFAHAHKLPALESWTYDKLLGISLESTADVILADLGAAQGHRMIPWFREFYRVMQESGLDLRWTALGVVDGDIASARSVIEWGEELQNTVDYVIVHNYFQEGVASAWENSKLASDVAAFRDAFSPVEIRIDARRPDLQRMMRTMNVTLSDVGERRTTVPELRAPDTYLIYPNDGRFRELPTLLLVVNGKSELVNFRVDGSRYVVDRLFDKAILVVGVGKKQTRVTITRETPYSHAGKEN